MYNIFSTFFLVFCFFLIIKLYQENKKIKNELLKLKEKKNLDDKGYIKSIRHLIRIQNYNSDSIKTTSPTTTKNGFLYDADDFGTMEKGVVYEGKTYIYDIETNNQLDKKNQLE